MRYTRYIVLSVMVLALASCVKDNFGVDIPVPTAQIAESMDPSVTVPSELLGELPQTKSLVGANTAVSFSSNFLRVDERIDGATGNGTYTFSAWNTATLMEGQAASPDNSANKLRALTLIPTQTYRIKGEKISDNQYRIDNYYHTRMVGWYPQTCQLAQNSDGKKVSTGIDAARNADGERIYSVEDGRTYIHFKNLGINRDLMMTDVKEAQQWHVAGSNEASDLHPVDGTPVYREPFGDYTGTPSYSNYFTFKHYRSAIRLYLEADQSEQNLSMWGTILNVRILNQPTACMIRVPEEQGTFAEYANQDIIWDPESLESFSINTDAMFNGDPSRENLNQTVSYPVELTGATSSNRVYLGYALVQPNTPVDIELHTTSGIYSVALKSTIVDKKTGEERQVLDAGTYYNITMSLQTKGAITEILESMDDEVFYDLSKEETFDGQEYTGLRYANCYIVDPASTPVTNALDEYLKRVNADVADEADKISKSRYDGFAFCATVIGNGEAGIISNNIVPSRSIISPYSARLIWETSKGLVTNVELIHGYVRFKVKYASATGLETVKGNALIGVYDKNNKILWSWHVWVTDTPAEVDLSGSKFLDRNLGATVAVPTSENQALLSYGLYYQWGRKDPSMYPPTYDYPIKSLLTSPYYDYAGETKNASEVRQYSRPEIKNGIDYPQFLLLPTTRTGGNYAYNWMYENYTDLWGDKGSGPVEKTLYDPCPYGYRVPGSELKTAVDAISTSGNNLNRTGYGWNYRNGQFFLPYAGFKGDDINSNSMTCAWMDVGNRGDYQTARTQTANTAQFHRERVFISKTQTWSYWVGDATQSYNNYYYSYYTNRRTAAPVRCVKDENMAGVITTGIDIKFPNTHGDLGDMLIAGEELSITWSASTTGNSTINSLSLLLNYTYNGEDKTVTVATITGDLGSSVQRTRVFTVDDIEYLSHITDGGYTFSVVATNNLERKASSSAQLKRRILEITDLTPEIINVGLGRSSQLEPTTIPSPLPEGVIRYVSADETVASVSPAGLIFGEKLGNTEITASIPSTELYTGIGSFTRPVSVVEPTAEIRFSSPTWHSAAADGNVYIGEAVEFYFELFDPKSELNRIAINVAGNDTGATISEPLGTTGDGYTRYRATITPYPNMEGDQEVAVIAHGNYGELDRDTRNLTFVNPRLELRLMDDDYFDRQTRTYTFYLFLSGISFADSNFGEINIKLDDTVVDYYYGNKPTSTPTTRQIDGKTYYKLTYSANSTPTVGTHDLYVTLKNYSDNSSLVESNHISFEYTYQYWVKATSTTELSGKTLVFVKDGKMISNTGLTMGGSFNPATIDYSAYTYTATLNNNAFLFRSRTNTGNMLRTTNNNALQLGGTASNNYWNVSYDSNSQMFTIRNTSSNRYILVNGNTVQASNNNGTAFEIWYIDFDVTFNQVINNAPTGKYVYDNNGTVALSASNTIIDFRHMWHVVDYHNGAFTVQNRSTNRYIVYAASAENPKTATGKPTDVNIRFTPDAAAQVVSVFNGNNTVYFNNWTGNTIGNQRFGFYGSNSNHQFIVSSE